MPPRILTLRPIPLAIIASLLWLVLSFSWSFFLIDTSFDRTMNVRLSDRTEQIARTVSDRLAGASLSPLSQSTDQSLQQIITFERRSDPTIVYIMLWDQNGNVLLHSLSAFDNTVLDVSQWPPLDNPGEARVSRITSAPWPLPDPGVTDVTVQLKLPGTVAYISAGFSQSWIESRFWQTQWRQLKLATTFTAAGLLAILGAIGLVFRAASRARLTQRQTDRARTSLLTERGMLASVLAHEVRSPLTALRFNLHNLRTLMQNPTRNPPRMIELADSCEREIRRLDLMLNDFLHRTQVISPPENTPVNQIVNEAIDFLRPALEQKNIRVILHLDPQNPIVSINADELRQVLLNLAANAQDAMPHGGTLALSTLTEADAVTLLVRDSGIGIPPEHRDRLFEPFFTTKPQGSGLGLALVRRVISGAGGSIFVESELHKGTTFRLTIPRPLETPPQTHDTPLDADAVAEPQADPNDATVDEPITQPATEPSTNAPTDVK